MDWRKPLLGVGIAAASGLMLGGAMKPDLGAGDRPEGPQIFAGWSGARSTGPFDDGRTLAYVEGQLPEYVVGTDWARPVSWQEPAAAEEAAPAADVSGVDAADQAPVHYAAAVWPEPAAEPPSYPSMSGGVRYDHTRPAEISPPPPPPPPTFDDEVMPEATGDTSLVVVEG